LKETLRQVEIDANKEIDRRLRRIYQLVHSLKEGDYWASLYYYEVPELENIQKALLGLIEKRSQAPQR